MSDDCAQSSQPLEDRAARRRAGRAERTWKLTLAYDGGFYAGWQVQPGRATVQGTLAAALERISGEQPLPQGSGRTDAGVHALGQVVSFGLCAAIRPESLQRALNHRLPASIRVLRAELAPEHFHARHSARSKLYEYRIWRGELCPPWIAPYVYACPWPLRLEAMQEAAQAVLGEHDFTSFAARQPDLTTRTGLPRVAGPRVPPTGPRPGLATAGPGLAAAGSGLAAAGPCAPTPCTRRLFTSAWEQRSADLLCYQVRGTGFLHHMVRNLVGTFLEIGRGNMAPGAIPDILAARDRSAAGATAPARGLFLHSVEY